jgi:hypothetical protein
MTPEEAVLDKILGQILDFHSAWHAGKEYIPQGAFRAMCRRYQELEAKQVHTASEAWEFARLFAFFSLVDGTL